MQNDDEAKTKKLNEQLEQCRGDLRKAQQAAADASRERDLLRPLVSAGHGAIVYLAKAEVFRPGGKHHQGFLGTVGPILKQLEQVLNPIMVVPVMAPVIPDKAPELAGTKSAGKSEIVPTRAELGHAPRAVPVPGGSRNHPGTTRASPVVPPKATEPAPVKAEPSPEADPSNEPA